MSSSKSQSLLILWWSCRAETCLAPHDEDWVPPQMESKDSVESLLTSSGVSSAQKAHPRVKRFMCVRGSWRKRQKRQPGANPSKNLNPQMTNQIDEFLPPSLPLVHVPREWRKDRWASTKPKSVSSAEGRRRAGMESTSICWSMLIIP